MINNIHAYERAQRAREQDQHDKMLAAHQSRAARRAAQQRAAEEAARHRAEQLDAAEAVPISDAVDADEAVRELEERIAAGDETVTADQLAEERTEAAGRVRFAWLRDLSAQRRARRDAEATELAQAEAAIVHAREALNGHTDAALVPLYDQVAAAVSELAQAVGGRNRVVRELVMLPHAERVRGVNQARFRREGPHTAVVPLPEGRIAPVQLELLLRNALAVAGVGRDLRPIPSHYGRDDRDPREIAAGRAQLSDGPDGAA